MITTPDDFFSTKVTISAVVQSQLAAGLPVAFFFIEKIQKLATDNAAGKTSPSLYGIERGGGSCGDFEKRCGSSCW